MKISIIGAGNMGSAIVYGLAKDKHLELMVSNPTKKKLEAIKGRYPQIETTSSNPDAAKWADIVILAVKPWIVQTVLKEILPVLDAERQQLVSIAAGITTSKISALLMGLSIPTYYVIPNTAISINESMTFISSSNAYSTQIDVVKSLFEKLGKVMIVDEAEIPACMALASCGIAYAMRYIRANTEGAVELGLKPNMAVEIMEQTLIGAAKLLESTGGHPEAEIDRVTTPGGLTIKGVNTLEENGFSSAIIKALKASV